jgi:retinol dehydrogenase 12
MKGKVCLITGATSGIGFAAARQIAAEGASVIITGRTPAKSEAAASHLRRLTGNGRIDWLAADFAALPQVRELAAEFGQRYPRLDVLINNAGTIPARRTLTAEGVELTLAVNHLAPFLLTNLLIDRLLAGAAARVVTVTSVAHERARFDFDDLTMRRGYLPFRAYARSKLANLLFTYELARRLGCTGVSANAANPGLVRTGLGRGNGPVRNLAWQLTHLRYRSVSLAPEQGADTIFYLASSRAVAGVTGEYFFERRPAQSTPASHDVGAAQRLWALSEQWASIHGGIERAGQQSAHSATPD